LQLKKGYKLKNDGSSKVMIIEQIQDSIANAVKAQLGRDAQKTHLYTKPYAKRVDVLCMLCGYQQLKFQLFDRKGNPKQHFVHFIKTCNNPRTGTSIWSLNPSTIGSKWNKSS